MDKLVIKETIVLEGRDDLINVSRFVDADIILTHGYHVARKTLNIIDSASKRSGIIIFTDPDRAGELIRQKVAQNASGLVKHAYITKSEARKAGDIGVENAEKEAIISALTKAKAVVCKKNVEFTDNELIKLGLSGGANSSKKREFLAQKLRIKLGNSKSLLRSLNSCGITKQELEKLLEEMSGK